MGTNNSHQTGLTMLRRKKKDEGHKSPEEMRKVVMLGAKLMCPFHPAPGVFFVTSNQIRLQNGIWGTEADNTKQNFLFTALCTHPSVASAPPPCISIITPLMWTDTGTVIVQGKKTLLKKSKIKCAISGQDITIIHDGQICVPSILTNLSQDVPMREPADKPEIIKKKDPPPRKVTDKEIKKAEALADEAAKIAAKYPNKTVALDGINTVSGWSDGRQVSQKFLQENNIVQIPLYETYNVAAEMGYTFDENSSIDNDMPGSAHACHAEKQIMVRQLGEPIGVSRDICPDCQDFAQKLADEYHDPIVIADQKKIYIFIPDEDPIVKER